jgi:hypothetical protein
MASKKATRKLSKSKKLTATKTLSVSNLPPDGHR